MVSGCRTAVRDGVGGGLGGWEIGEEQISMSGEEGLFGCWREKIEGHGLLIGVWGQVR